VSRSRARDDTTKPLVVHVELGGRLARWATRRAKARGLSLSAWLVDLVERERQAAAQVRSREAATRSELEHARERDATAELAGELLAEGPELFPELFADGDRSRDAGTSIGAHDDD
jgi:hypothetical protein